MPDQLTNPEPTNEETCAALWRNFTTTHPHWLDRGADLTPIGVKALFETVAKLGYIAGVKRGRADERIARELARRRRRNYAGFLKHLYANLGAPADGESPPEVQPVPERAA